MRTTPCIWRRSPNGSRDPVAFSPALVSADDRIELVGERHRRPRHRRRAELRPRRRRVRLDADRQVVVVDRLPHLPRAAPPRARRCRPSCPAARGTRTPCRWSGRPSRGAPPSRHVAASAGCPNSVVAIHRPASRSAPPCRDSCPASCGTAPCAADRAATRASVLRSASQKNFASRSRAVTTRSAFFAMTRSSCGWVLTTARNASFSSPFSASPPGNQC